MITPSSIYWLTRLDAICFTIGAFTILTALLCIVLVIAGCALRTALRDIRDDVLDMVIHHKNENPDSYAHGLCLSIGGACDMALNATKEYDNANE